MGCVSHSLLSTAQSWPKTSVFRRTFFLAIGANSLTLLHEGNTMRRSAHYSLPSFSWFCRRHRFHRSIGPRRSRPFRAHSPLDGSGKPQSPASHRGRPGLFLSIHQRGQGRQVHGLARKEANQFAADRRKHSGDGTGDLYAAARRIKICSWNRYAERHRFCYNIRRISMKERHRHSRGRTPCTLEFVKQ